MAASDVAGAQGGVVVPEVPDTLVTYDGAMTATKDIIMPKLTTNIVEDVPPGDISPADLPLRMFRRAAGTYSGTPSDMSTHCRAT